MQKTLANKKSSEEKFNQLLDWLSENRDESAREYHDIQNRLILYFSARGCVDAENLADQTIDRIAEKISSENFEYEGNKMKYFYGFARNIYHEYLRHKDIALNEEILEDESQMVELPTEEEISQTQKYLNDCLSKLNRKDKKLILIYYNAKTGREKEYREKVAKKYKISTNSLRVKIFRLKKIIEDCVLNKLNS